MCDPSARLLPIDLGALLLTLFNLQGALVLTDSAKSRILAGSNARSLRRSSSPTRTRSAGLRVGVGRGVRGWMPRLCGLLSYHVRYYGVNTLYTL